MRETKNSRLLVTAKLASGIRHHHAKTESWVLLGKPVTVAALLAMLEQRIAGLHAVCAAKARYHDAVKEEHAMLAQTDELYGALVQYVHLTHGPSADALAEFGLLPRKPRRALTGAEVAQKAARAAATREARHTLGRRERLAVKGEARPRRGMASPAAATPSPARSASNGATVPRIGSS